jgi:hypothetical protein
MLPKKEQIDKSKEQRGKNKTKKTVVKGKRCLHVTICFDDKIFP